MLAIRLRRTGSKKNPHYRVVVTESSSKRDGRFVEILGHYDPRQQPVAIEIDAERAKHWLGQGARPSDTVKSLLKQLQRQTAA